MNSLTTTKIETAMTSKALPPLQVGLLGIGTVGRGVFDVLQRNQEEILHRTGRNIHIAMVADLDTARAQSIVGAASVAVVDDARKIIANPAINTVVELIGGYGIAYQLVMQAIEAGKNVVTANKALLAVHGAEIFAAAQRKGVIVAFEAAVAGGIPIIKTLREGLTANRIAWIAGIINGTTNFILSQMRDKGWSFQEALAQAQQLGYAEADPSFDIEGIDAAHKITLMASLGFGISIQFNKAYVEGITKLQTQDIHYAEQLGYRIKLLGIAKKTKLGIELRVHPSLVSSKRLIANVEGAMNAVVVHGDAVGTTLYYGKGAGSEPTASAVIADLVDVARMHAVDQEHRTPPLAFQPDHMRNTPVLPIGQVVSSYYLRLRVLDEAGVLSKVTGILAGLGINIDAILQPAAEQTQEDGTTPVDLVILTHDCLESTMDQALALIQALPVVLTPITRIRKEDLD